MLKKTLIAASLLSTSMLSSSPVLASDTIEVTDQNYAHAETARNYRNWVALGANQQITHMRNLPPRGNKAPTVQMNDDTLYSVVVAQAIDGRVQFDLPKTEVYSAVQVVTEGGHGQHYVVGAGRYDLPVETDYVFLIYRTGMEKGLDVARQTQDLYQDDSFKFDTYTIQNYGYDKVEEWTARLTEETQGEVFEYTFPRTSNEITDRHQWNLENANGWGGSSPEAGVANKYTNSVMLDGGKCLTTTFDDPKSKYFTSVTAYDNTRYLIEGVTNVNSHTWSKNADGTVTVSFNCGEQAVNNIDTKGQDFSFTMRYYGVSQPVMDGKISPEMTVK
ncbi:DUF1214 domain-containing protein [Vibrio paucivorans]|uniref:DUF1214 domain-containing protein n=1 Tax=Vibrio paucivorans TaxID=2829489 RepID=A0A9X3HUB1_9VIBR|nr:DUF1214 domain-containing protein [Vibrio paucivorans]MCW8336446.1 DUF1214 domain-containing protein [Vibrio paucivorans]